ncbi:amino acid/amide ABC transporter membrane protein 2, HAAT family [Rhizobiales bacterium GAS191]|jgi:branched-chain amino acid transport system permease protein|nr:branched-chain amino acid transport system permease protein [Rhizobiales bacterium GAS113]SED69381.1 amino acid/amide ABC transporter membrane protein 2, HAAT family [Rhizobiales bacterium GAS188]SEE82816.1 amino acid/amide ABC transporter membrane protein 2, HAAT family [Rhizobiales bacterium GAS191]
MTLDLLGPGLIAYASFFLATALSYAIICLGLNLQWGQTGLFNVGVAGFVAVGAYTSALVTTPATTAHLAGFDLPIPVGWLAAMLVAGAVSAFVGAVTLRLRADYLAITTFGIAVTIHLVTLNAQRLTGGPFGIGFIPRPFAALAETPLAFNLANLALIVVLLAILYVGLERLVRSPWGRVLRAIREEETAAISLGKNADLYRLQAFALGGAVMGLGGAVQAHFIGFIAPDNYLSSLTFQIWTMLIIGGSGNNRGAILGAVLIWAIWSVSGTTIASIFPPEQQARAAALQIVAIGVMLSAALLLRPRGLIGELSTVSRHIDRGAEGEAKGDPAP